MALDESALSDLLASLQAGDGVDLVRELARCALQELIEVEASSVIGAGRYERSDARMTERNGHRPRVVSTRPAICMWRSRSCATGRSSRRCWSRVGGSTRRCTRW